MNNIMVKESLVFVFILSIGYCFIEDQCDYVYNILPRHGYSYENHTVETSDGFTLSLFRVTGRIGSDIDENKPTIIMQHGINASPNSFLSNGESSIVFYLVNRGFEIWLPSARGTSYSSKHKTLLPNDTKYWDYSFEDLGMKDTRAYVDYIYRFKKQRKVIYFGYSQGFMQMLAAFSLDPEFFKERIRKIVGWGPAARIDLSSNVWLALTTYVKVWPLASVDNILGIMHTAVFDRESCLAGVKQCEYFRPFCSFKKMFNSEFLPYNNNPYYASGSDASSVKCLQHLAYNVYERGFYRLPINGKKEAYDLKKITVPLAIFVGEADMLAPPANGKWLARVFKDSKEFKLHIYDYLGHATFTASYTQFQHYTDTYNFLIS